MVEVEGGGRREFEVIFRCRVAAGLANCTSSCCSLRGTRSVRLELVSVATVCGGLSLGKDVSARAGRANRRKITS